MEVCEILSIVEEAAQETAQERGQDATPKRARQLLGPLTPRRLTPLRSAKQHHLYNATVIAARKAKIVLKKKSLPLSIIAATRILIPTPPIIDVATAVPPPRQD